jgi:hypothetical protein
MKRKKILFFTAIIFSFWFCDIFSFTINRPGRYVLGDDIIEIGIDVISIQTSNVILDLAQHTVAGGINGIVVEAGNSGIVIQNGFVAGLLNSGVLIKENCNGIKVERLQIAECGGPAVEILGTSTAQVSNIFVDYIVTSSCSLSPLSSSVFSAAYGKTVVFTDIVVNGVINPLGTVSLVKLDHCNESFGVNILGTNNTAAGIVGMDMINSSSCVFKNCNFSGNLALTGDFCGYRLTDSSSLNIFEDCRILAGKSLVAHTRGFHTANGCSANIFRQCSINALDGVSTYGFAFVGPANDCNIVRDCFVSKNFSSTGSMVGFLIEDSNKGKIVRSFAGYNMSSDGLAAGLQFTDSLGGDFWNILENEFLQNNGATASDSYGVLLQTGTGSVFIKNISSENGTIDANQFSGVPVTAVTLVTPDTINTIVAPWTNVGIVP